ncbi:glucose-dependent insulinotropic receptor [Syngnathoides biaculeatus]|uniref:glucose-dependent insulinotropic receptor n=1 Tax=Syngnathoides biaculeatus TaxID=300417 RepID=UPI002ADE1988|nr:glucose-dependent insulinotropic receptor [Syngnathoides biaculeatus]
MTPAEVRPRVTGFVLSVASCLIVGTNLLVAVALLRLLAKRRSQSWCFVLNLALGDTLVGLAITGLAADDFSTGVTSTDNRYVRQGSRNFTSTVLGKSRCLMRMAFVMSPCTASILSMFVISLDRYAAIKVPLRYSRLSGKGTPAASLVALWAFSVIVGFLPAMVRQLQTDAFVICPTGIIVLFSVCFFTILSVFVFIYMDILKIACGHQRQIFRISQAGSRTADGHCRPTLYPRTRSQFRSHVKALRTVALLVGCFLTLWCPFFVREVRTEIADIFACLAGRGSAPGPVLEVWDHQSHAQT